MRVFKTNRGDADEDAELAALDKMREIRVMSSVTDSADIMTIASEDELGLLARDACSLQFSVLLGRNFHLLDRDVVESKGRSYIDLWLAEETDPVLFLTAHCLSLTSVWKRHAVLRIVSVCWDAEAVEEVLKHGAAILKQHRIKAELHVVVLEPDSLAIFNDAAAELAALATESRPLPRFGSACALDEPVGTSLADLAKDKNNWSQDCVNDLDAARRLQDAFRVSLDIPMQRAIILNRVIKREVARNGGQTALVMSRVEDPPSGSLAHETHAKWARHLMSLSQDLPPTLLFCGGGTMMLTQDW